MTIFETISLALILSLESFVVAARCSAIKKIQYSKGLILAILFCLFHAGFWFLGFIIGDLLCYDAATIDACIGFVLILFVALKMIMTSLRKPKDENLTFVTNAKSIVLFSLASSINFFIVGIGWGLMHPAEKHQYLAMILLAIFTLLTTLFGVFSGRQGQRKARKWITFLAGILLVVLSLNMLFGLKII